MTGADTKDAGDVLALPEEKPKYTADEKKAIIERLTADAIASTKVLLSGSGHVRCSMNIEIGETLGAKIEASGGKSVFFPQIAHFRKTGEKDSNGKAITELFFETQIKTANIATFIHDRLKTVAFNNTIFCYDAIAGIYSEDKGQVNAVVNELCRICDCEDVIPKVQLFTQKILLGKNVYIGDYPFDQIPEQIPFKNGTLRLKDEKWVLENKVYTDMVTWRIPHDYETDEIKALALITPVKDVLDQWVMEEDVRTLLQVPAHALRHLSLKLPYKLEYLIIGKRDSAKSTYISLIEEAFKGMISSVPVQEIGGQFKSAVMESKLFNIYDDLDNRGIKNLGTFKKFTGKFEHDIEHKGKDEYRGLIRCVHLFSANPPLPKVDVTDDEAFWSRWRMVLFPNHFRRDPDWFKRTITEDFIKGFFRLILVEYEEIIKNGIYNPQTPEDVKQAWLGTADEIPFILSELDVQQEGYTGEPYQIPVDECYKLYTDYMSAQKKQCKDKPQFGRAIAYAVGATVHRPRVDGKHVNTYYNIRKKVRPDDPPHQPDGQREIIP